MDKWMSQMDMILSFTSSQGAYATTNKLKKQAVFRLASGLRKKGNFRENQ